jgi:hypothetical protein
MATPAIVDGTIIVRGRQHVFAIKQSEAKAPEPEPAPAAPGAGGQLPGVAPAQHQVEQDGEDD